MANAVVVLFFPVAVFHTGKSLTFGFLAAVSLAQAVFTWRLIPETRNMPLETIEGYWVQQIEI